MKKIHAESIRNLREKTSPLHLAPEKARSLACRPQLDRKLALAGDCGETENPQMFLSMPSSVTEEPLILSSGTDNSITADVL